MILLATLSLFAIFASFLLAFLQGAPQTPPPADIAPIVTLVTERALTLAVPVKLLVDRLGLGLGLKGRTLFILSMIIGVGFDLGIGVIGATTGTGYKFTAQVAVMALFAGVLAGIGSKVLTDNHEATKNPTPT